MNKSVMRAGVSIRSRLTVWYAASVLFVLLVFATALRTVVRSTLSDEFAASVESSASAVAGFFRFEFGEYHDVHVTLAHLATEVVLPDRVMEFVRPDGTVAFRTVPLQHARRSGSMLPVESLLPGPLRHASIALAPDLAPGWTVRAYASGAALDRSLRRIDGWLLVGIPLGVLFAATAGWWLAGRALRPVGAMAAAAERMTRARETEAQGASQSGQHRLPINRPDDEFGRLGTRFNELLDQIDGVLGQQRRFLADAAHELRTPVARMLGGVELALMDPDDGAGHRLSLQRVQRDLERTALLVDQLLLLSRADVAGVIRCRPAFADDIVADTVHAWHLTAERRGVRLVVSRLEEAPAMLDPVFFERLVGILVDNALRYTPREGIVEVQVWWDAGAHVAVADTGIGIGDEDRHQVFERFYRGAGARAMAPDGSGLGLPIARQIADAHGATIVLAARAEGGTVATVVLPAVSPREAGARRPLDLLRASGVV